MSAGQQSPLLKPVIEQMKYFLRHGEGDKQVFGSDVLLQDLEKCEKNLAKQATKEGDVTRLAVYKWLRPREHEQRVQEVLQQYRAKAQESIKCLASQSKRNPDSKAAVSIKKKKKDAAMEAALAMFK